MLKCSAMLVLSVCLLAAGADVRAATIDTTTQGNWIGKYGSEGYILNGYLAGGNGTYVPSASTANDLASLPSFVTSYSYSSGFQQYVWETGSSDQRDLQDPRNPSGGRNASTSFISNDGNTQQITLNVGTPTNFQLAIYGLDWDNFNGRDATLTVNGESVEFDNTSPPSAYHNGEWAVFDVSAPAGSLVIDFKGNASANSNSVLSGIMFDPIPEPATLSVLGAAVGLGLIRRRRIAIDRHAVCFQN